MVGGPAHGPRVDVVQLAACARARGALVTLAILEELLLAMSHRRRDGAVVPCRDEGQPPQNGGDGDNVAVYIRTTFFSKIYHFFLQMTTFFSKPMECSIEFSVRWTERRTGPILS